MTRFTTLIFIICILASVHQAAAADNNVRICALTKAYECTSEDGCQEWSVQEIALPRFVRIDLKAKTIKSLDKDIPRETGFREIDRLQGMLVLHGTEQRGWSMALGEDSGTLTLSASGNDESFVVFGSCITP